MALASKKLGISQTETELIYKSYWKFIKETIHELDLEGISEQEFKECITNFNIPYIGKLYTNYEKIEKYNRKIKYLDKYVKIKRNKTAV